MLILLVYRHTLNSKPKSVDKEERFLYLTDGKRSWGKTNTQLSKGKGGRRDELGVWD